MQMLRKKLLTTTTFTILVSALLAINRSDNAIQMQSLQMQTLAPGQAAKVQSAMDGLWSANDHDRMRAKAELIRLGDKAVPELTSLLKDLITDGTARYARGTEQEGEAFNKKLEEVKDKADLEKLGSEALNNPRVITINYRLKTDVCEILATLKAEAAVPPLIEMMWKEDRISAWESFNPAMEALIGIGNGCVPQLIEAIDNAESLVAVRIGSESPFTPEEIERMIKRDADELRVRAAMVLGRIGDERALPVVQRLMDAAPDNSLRVHIRDALKNLQAQSIQHTRQE